MIIKLFTFVDTSKKKKKNENYGTYNLSQQTFALYGIVIVIIFFHPLQLMFCLILSQLTHIPNHLMFTMHVGMNALLYSLLDIGKYI